jgi:hypothetical protein
MYRAVLMNVLKASGGLYLVAKMKNDNNKKATSHMAVISTLVLFLGNLALPIFQLFMYIKIQIP